MDGVDETGRTKSSAKFLPKEDTDMTTLGLIQIPGTPSSNCADHEKSGKMKKNARGLKASDSLDVLSVQASKEKSERSSLLVGNKKRRSHSSSSDPLKTKHKKIKHQRSFEKTTECPEPHDVAHTTSANAGDIEGNSDVAGPVQIRRNRVSTVSNESTPITHFD